MEIRVEGLKYVYSPKTPWKNCALNDISFVVPSFAVLGILGSTGSGKTTLLKNLNGLFEPTAGNIYLDGTDTKVLRSELPKIVGLIFQCPERQLFEKTVLEDIAFTFRIDQELSEEEIFERAKKACEDVGLDLNEIESHSSESLSEASRRKLAIACVLLNDPRIIIFDEPLAGMDPYSSLELVKMIARMKTQRKRTIIIVSHDMAPFMPSLDLMMALDRGSKKAFGSCRDVCEELLKDPKLSELLPPIVRFKDQLSRAGINIPKNEFDPRAILKYLSSHEGQGC